MSGETPGPGQLILRVDGQLVRVTIPQDALESLALEGIAASFYDGPAVLEAVLRGMQAPETSDTTALALNRPGRGVDQEQILRLINEGLMHGAYQLEAVLAAIKLAGCAVLGGPELEAERAATQAVIDDQRAQIARHVAAEQAEIEAMARDCEAETSAAASETQAMRELLAETEHALALARGYAAPVARASTRNPAPPTDHAPAG